MKKVFLLSFIVLNVFLISLFINSKNLIAEEANPKRISCYNTYMSGGTINYNIVYCGTCGIVTCSLYDDPEYCTKVHE